MLKNKISLVFLLWGILAAGELRGVVYVSDMGQCQPSQALSSQPQRDKWQLIAYQCADISLSGTMIGSASYDSPPEVTVPLNLTGWHSVYLAYWNPGFDDDGADLMLKAKFTGDEAFRQLYEASSSDTTQATFLREVFFENADLTGKNLVIAKANGLRGKKLYLAYIKCVPLSASQSQSIEQDRAQVSTRNLVATIDGMSYFHFSQYDTISHIQEQVAMYKYSDVGKVLWAVNYGDTTNFRSSASFAQWTGSSEKRIASMVGFPSNDYTRGEKQTFDTLRLFDTNQSEYINDIASLTHGMGLKFDIMMRLGIISGGFSDPNNYVNMHPQFRQKLKDGTPLGKVSYAYPQVRQFMLSIIQDAAQRLDVDGVNLCFVRGPSFLLYEDPVIDAFVAAYGVDPRQLPSNDPRVGIIRASFMTQFVSDARTLLNQIGAAKGKPVELSVWVWPSNQNVWLGSTPLMEGLDVQAWISQGLIDSLICQEGTDAGYMQLCQQYNCPFILFTGYSGDKVMSPAHVAEAYNAGVQNFAFWDIDSWQIFPREWAWIRRIGHQTEMAAWNYLPYQPLSIKLKTLNGTDVSELSDAVYFGQ